MRRGASGCASARRRSRRALCRGSCCGFERFGCDRARVARETAFAHRGQGFRRSCLRRERAVPGVVLLRIDSENTDLKAMRLAAAIERYGEGPFGRYMVIEEGRFRSRQLWSGS